jgi:acetyl esterase
MVGAIPTRANRLLGGRPIRIDGQQLHPEAQAMLRTARLLGLDREPASIAAERAATRREARLVRGRPIEAGEVRPWSVPGAAGDLDARLYVPANAPASGPLTLYFHGGGWCIGDLDTHDQVCRHLCRRAGVRVLSVAYRLAPEHPFPAGIEDALEAMRFAVGEGAAPLGADPGAVAVAGDSAGATLATVVCQITRDGGEPTPRFQALIYPRTDRSRRYPSRDLFADGFYLTDSKLARWEAAYLPPSQPDTDPRVSPLLANLAGLPPAYVLVAGFDPFRDEVREYARRLAEAGVEVAVGEKLDLFHGFISALGVSARYRTALDPLADALGAALRR